MIEASDHPLSNVYNRGEARESADRAHKQYCLSVGESSKAIRAKVVKLASRMERRYNGRKKWEGYGYIFEDENENILERG